MDTVSSSGRALPDPLPDFIENNREAILQEWDSFARSLDFERTMSPETQRDHAAQMLDAIASDMRTPQSPVSREMKGKGLNPDDPSGLQAAGHEHALDRLAEQFSLSELVSELRAVRASVMRLWARQQPDVAAQLNEIVRFNESIDEILAASSQSYSVRINEARNVIIGILAHDLRLPIHSVMLGTRYLLQSDATDSNGIKAVARMQRAASEIPNWWMPCSTTRVPASATRFRSTRWPARWTRFAVARSRKSNPPTPAAISRWHAPRT